MAVGLSFVFLAITQTPHERSGGPRPIHRVPRSVRLLLRGTGLLAWVWIVAQTLVGGTSDADVASLFLWDYGWVALAIVSAVIGPIWSWIDPFSTLYDLGAQAGRWVGLRGGSTTPYPLRLGHWPAVVGFCLFVWMELTLGILSGRSLGLVLIGYTVITLAAMSTFGRDTWRERGETFSVWFGVLGRMAPFALAAQPSEGVVSRQGFGGGLRQATWSPALLALLAVAAGSILYDGLSQTVLARSLIGSPGLVGGSLLLAGFMTILTATIMAVARSVGVAVMAAGLVPVALGYLVAHYLPTLLVDGQRMVIALSDPLQQGWDLFGFAFYEPQQWLPASAAWSIQLAAVVGGHVVGAWAGHTVAERSGQSRPAAQLPLALTMIALTTATLWSLGQDLVTVEEEGPPAAIPSDAPRIALHDLPRIEGAP